MAAKTGIYESLRPPLHQVSDTIQGAYILLVAVIGIVLSGLVVAVNLHATVSAFGQLRKNDFAIIAALVFAIGYSVAIGEAVQQGLGSAASELVSSQMRALSQSYYTSNILLFLSLGSSKSAVAMLILAVGKQMRWVKVSSYALLAISVAWALVATVVVALQCSPTRWVLGPNGTDTCIDQFAAQIAIKAIDIVTDIALAILPAFMMARVQAVGEFRKFSNRLVVSLVFGVRLVTPIFTSVSIASLSTFYNAAVADRPSEAVSPCIWTSLAVNMSLITACVPSIRRLMQHWAAGIANAGVMEPYEIQNSAEAARSGRPISTRKFSRSEIRAQNWPSSNHKETRLFKYHAREMNDQVRVGSDRDSQRCLTDGIRQTVDISIDYNDS